MRTRATKLERRRPRQPATSARRRSASTVGLLVILAAGLLLSACGSSGSAAAPAAVDATAKKFDPASFESDPARGANPYLPLVPGMQGVREGSTLVGGRKVPHQVTTTVTDGYRMIDGVRTVLMYDYEVDGGQVSQVSLDYAAEDKSGNVWILGGYTQEYEGGRLVGGIDPWMQGVNGAKAGIVVQADPRVDTPFYSVARPDAKEGDVAEVIKVGVRHCVPFDCFNDVLVVREGKATAPDNEFKYYASGVGQIDNVPHGDSVHDDVEKLVNLTTLSPKALSEATTEALKVDANAPKQSPKIFAGKPLATRGL